MTARNDPEPALSAWLAADAAVGPPPEPLARILATTRAMRPRPAFVAGVGSAWVGDAAGARRPFAGLRPAANLALLALLGLVLLGAAAVAGGLLNARRDAVPGVLEPAGTLVRPMARPVLAPLADGRVLVIGAGGDGEDQTVSAELFDPATRRSEAAGPLVPVPWAASATALADGRVLVIGGDGLAQVFDPKTAGFTRAGAMVEPRPDTSAVLLEDGRVLVVGRGLRSAELFDPATLSFSRTGDLPAPPTESVPALRLPDGRVLVIATVQTVPDATWAIEAEVYDPATATFAAAGRTADFGVAAPALLPDGRVLILGSTGMTGENRGLAAIWDPAARAFTDAPAPVGRVSKAVRLEGGRILVLGFVQFPRDPSRCPVRTLQACSWAGVYDPATGTTTLVPPPAAWMPSVLRLADGRVLVVGGIADGDIGPAPAGNGAPAVSAIQLYR